MAILKLKSPVSGKLMERVTLESGLQAYRCPSSGGHYITSTDYMEWLMHQPERLPHLPKPQKPVEHASESPGALICPESGTIMSRSKVGHGFGFSIDRSITGGVWLDRGEWEGLRERNFHDEIHLVFTAPWQKHVRDEHSQKVYESTLVTSLGEDLLGRLTALRNELMDHPHKNLAISYLTERENSLDEAER